MSKRFRIALSFTGEKRGFVADVARILAAKFSEDKILYDKYHEAEFARPDLAFHLPKLYNDNADLVVAVLCNDYEKKEWCGLEWSAIYGRIKKREVKEVMLCRFDRVEGAGLYGLSGFLDLDTITPEQAATRILERLAINEGKPKDHYTKPATTAAVADWPIAAPALHWPVADHTDAREAFARLITCGSAHRYLPIAGISEMGKSHLTNQFLANAHGIDGLRCARFDFKGSADLDSSLATFATHLEVPAPKATGVSAQLAEIFTALKAHARPTLLIFDTFERAGDADRWIKDRLLLGLSRLPWMRVIIVGQKVPPGFGQAWAKVSAPTVTLTSPTVQEWFEFSQLHMPTVTLAEVQTAHKLAGDRIALLAQMLGPAA